MLKIIFWTIVIILILSFFGISIQNLVAQPTTQANFGFVWQIVINIWNAIVAALTLLLSPAASVINAVSTHVSVH